MGKSLVTLVETLTKAFQQFEAAIQECIKNYPNQEAVFKSRTFALLNDTVTVLLDYGTALRFSPGFFLDPHPCNNSDEEKPNCTVYSSDLDFTNDPAEEVYLESIQERIPINRARAEGTKTFLDYIIISEVMVEN